MINALYLVLAATVPPAYVQAANQHALPPGLVYAVARCESNTKLTSGAVRPWPWTLNVAGAPYRFATRRAAYRKFIQVLDSGRRNVDAGLMQVNWRWHGDRLKDPWLALEPHHNLDAGAAILRQRLDESGDWLTAAGRYHCPGSREDCRARAARYRSCVAGQLQIIDGVGP